MKTRELKLQLARSAMVFRREADYDYISARANFRMALPQQFLWAGSQAVEKYLKAILLFNCRDSRYGHNLKKLHNAVKEIDYLRFDISENEPFLIAIQQGVDRYLTQDSSVCSDFLRKLDNLVWDTRRYCQSIALVEDYENEGGQLVLESIISKINNPYFKQNKASFRFSAGEDSELEKTINGKNNLRRQNLLWKNTCFGENNLEGEDDDYLGFSSITNAIEYTPELDEYILFPSHIKKSNMKKSQ